ncbi:MAG: HAD-IIIC family phosphatase, partial [Terriglobia bacterium]
LFAHPRRLSSEGAERLVQERAEELTRLVLTLLERLSTATCYVVAFGTDRAPMEHILDPQAPMRGQAAVQQLLEAVRALGTLSPRVVVVDWDWYTRRLGTAAYRDERLWYLARMRLNPMGFAALAELIAHYVAAYSGRSRKVAVIDLDNTLWGGIVGEVGVRGIVLGEDGPGLAYQDFQRELLKLHDMGIIVAICSKNNPDDAWEVFDRHPGMVLQREHLAAVRINWQDKVSNLREMAEELNLGLDSFVFFDDSPIEREWVRKSIPEVLIPDLPKDPAERAAFLSRLTFFQRITVTEADLRRPQAYKAQDQRVKLQSRAASLEEFLVSLEQEVIIEPIQESSLARAAQLCQRTNQFNLTSQRYSVADIERMANNSAIEIYSLAVKDRFGDSGITGLGILRFAGEKVEVDTFLLSCRVLGRKIEDVFFAFLATRATDRGARYLIGRYIPTRKNQQVERFYLDRGAQTVAEGLFILDLEHRQFETPPEISIKAVAHA